MAFHKTPWLNCFLSQPNSKCQLICFPHAGGSAAFFRDWPSKLPEYEIYSVCYPGRGERITEPLPIDLVELSKDISRAIYNIVDDRPIAFFGHSMGAAIALETARSLESLGVSIYHLFASGSRNGVCPPSNISKEVEDDHTICTQLLELGGTDPEIVNDPIFKELILPSVRADGKMFHNYKMTPKPFLQCQVTTIYGDKDPHADIRPWYTLAPNGFEEKCVHGNHFYLITTPPFNIIHESLKSVIDIKKPRASDETK